MRKGDGAPPRCKRRGFRVCIHYDHHDDPAAKGRRVGEGKESADKAHGASVNPAVESDRSGRKDRAVGK